MVLPWLLTAVCITCSRVLFIGVTVWAGASPVSLDISRFSQCWVTRRGHYVVTLLRQLTSCRDHFWGGRKMPEYFRFTELPVLVLIVLQGC